MHLFNFFYPCLKISKGWGCNFTWSFGKVRRIKSLKMVFVARIIRHKLCMIYAFFDYFFQKTFLTKSYSFTPEINLTSRGPLYTCLVWLVVGFENWVFCKVGTLAIYQCYKITPCNAIWCIIGIRKGSYVSHKGRIDCFMAPLQMTYGYFWFT